MSLCKILIWVASLPRPAPGRLLAVRAPSSTGAFTPPLALPRQPVQRPVSCLDGRHSRCMIHFAHLRRHRLSSDTGLIRSADSIRGLFGFPNAGGGFPSPHPAAAGFCSTFTAHRPHSTRRQTSCQGKNFARQITSCNFNLIGCPKIGCIPRGKFRWPAVAEEPLS